MSEGAENLSALQARLTDLRQRALSAFEGQSSEHELRAERAKFINASELKQLQAAIPKLPGGDRKELGKSINEYKGAVEGAFEARLKEIAQLARKKDLEGPPFDLTLPGRLELGRGHAHPIHQVRDDLLGIFRDLGFLVVGGPEVELEENNFTKLAFPPDHPATDMQDSFWVNDKVLLRTHTSNVQVREMSSRKPPMAIVSAGPVYRRDDDMTHSPMFHQIEGFLVDEKVTFAELKGVLTAFAERLYGAGVESRGESSPSATFKVRFRPSYFPFVEPGAELDVTCVFCGGNGCRVCKQTGFIEVLGCGMVHPDVFRHCGIDPEKYTGFAFGMGIERTAMLRYGIPNIKLLFENDPRFLAQF